VTRRQAVIAAGVAGGLLALGVLGALVLAYGARPKRLEVTVVLREGWTMYDHAAALRGAGVAKSDDFLRACRDPEVLALLPPGARDAEGFLFPDTYRFHVPTPAREVVLRLVRAFRRRAGDELDRHRADAEAIGRTLGRDGTLAVVTLASLVEAEAAVDGERPLIASVLWNRLTGKDPDVTRLQVDPTATYGCRRDPSLASCRGWRGGEPTRRMLADEANPYNTYRHEGLPPGPIGNPGLASIRAVLERRATSFLFYVARGDGTHVFSETYEEHRRSVEERSGP
jgi:UPF0755 protein